MAKAEVKPGLSLRFAHMLGCRTMAPARPLQVRPDMRLSRALDHHLIVAEGWKAAVAHVLDTGGYGLVSLPKGEMNG